MEKVIDKIKSVHEGAATKKCVVWVTVAVAFAYVAAHGQIQLVIGG